MRLTVEAIYEGTVFRPLTVPALADRQRVLLQVEPVGEAEARAWGSYDSLRLTFEEMSGDGGIDDDEWERVEADMKAADLLDTERTALEVAATLRD